MNNPPKSKFDETLAPIVDARLETVARKFPPGDESPSSVRKRLEAYRNVIKKFMQEINRRHNQDESGIAVCGMISDVMDRLVIHSYEIAFNSGRSAPGLAIIALGGYGRRELNPYSDIDILCLIREDAAGLHDNHITGMLRFLWDMNLDLGHSTRTTGECIEAAEDDIYFATSLLEGRFLRGDEDAWKELKEKFSKWLRQGAGLRMVMQKIEERRLRLDSFHGTVQIQKPDVKECPGTLRDIHVSRWLLLLTGRGKSIRDFSSSGFLKEEDTSALEDDLDFFLRIRNALHFLTGKKADLLNHIILPEVAKNLKYRGRGDVPVEKLMHDYYMRAGRVHRQTNRISEKIRILFTGEASPRYTSTPEGILIGNSNVRIPPEKTKSLHMHLRLLITLFAVAGARRLTIEEETASAISGALEKHPVNLSENTGVRTAFHEIINMKKGVAHALRLMHEHGALIKLIPEFDEINWHYQFDFYHAYTTDEHSIRVVENLERMAIGSSKVPELSELMTDVTARGALYLAGLMHDIGKGRGSNHSHRGEFIAARVLKRLGFDRRTIDLVRFLIREHLLMTHISQRRDMDDRDTICDFIERVGSTGRLRMLTLLTFADLMALSDEVLTEWKKALLLDLYKKGMMLIERGFEEHIDAMRKHSIDSIVEASDRHLPGDVVRKHLNLLPDQYIRVTDHASIRAHIRGTDRMKKLGAWASFKLRDNISLLTVITPDYPKALSDICGTITSSDINIIGARIFTRNDGIIIDTFLVTDGSGEALIPSETQKIFKKNLVRMILKEANVKELIASHLRRWRRRKKNVVFSPPKVNMHNDISSKYTVVDVFAIDYTGLLYDITSVLASFNIDIHTAKIGTDEDQVADAFYIQKRGGGKIEDGQSIKLLKEAIIERLSEAYG
ncbi:MAG: [protein-PII] uridylyltransferase [Candidatus Latescibacteria bacterium]|jgi:[protein-PII] uridylyltransferase|nr:[protein-PII] uridylyltransferase [Candidatus Latescibacterota bacterium]